jgi:hypothetical protein
MRLLSLIFMAPWAAIRFSLWSGAWIFVTVGLWVVALGMWFSRTYDGLGPWLMRRLGEKSPARHEFQEK